MGEIISGLAEAMSAQQLVVVGGPSTKHPNQVLLSGNNKYDTAAAVAKYLALLTESRR